MSSNALKNLTKQSFFDNIIKSRELEGELISNYDFNKTRCRVLTKNEMHENSKGILYWMSRDCRVQDNWAFLFAQRLALKQQVPLHVCFFTEDSKELYPTRRQFKFLIDGLKHVKKECEDLNIGFHLLQTTPLELNSIIKSNEIGCIVSDFTPLRKIQFWKNEVLKLIGDTAFVEVDAHNIVPVWVASDKQEVAARTIRPKINKKLDEYLTTYPKVSKHPHSGKLKLKLEVEDFDKIIDNFKPDNIKEVSWATAGPESGLETLYAFITQKLINYGTLSSDPSKDAVSNLSPWIHFGQISAQRCAYEIRQLKSFKNQSEKFLEELIVRRELSDNFCYYNENYDQFNGADEWAKKTLNDHRKDKRQYIYSKEEFENAKTHDEIWNSAQLELLQQGKIHGYMRMYWCKKILEWTKTPEEAIEIALYLNDYYSLDGSDPNGFVGVMWSICGVHDHGWKEREIFGKIRYMVDYSLRNKFDIDSYCRKFGKQIGDLGNSKRGKKRRLDK